MGEEDASIATHSIEVGRGELAWSQSRKRDFVVHVGEDAENLLEVGHLQNGGDAGARRGAYLLPRCQSDPE